MHLALLFLAGVVLVFVFRIFQVKSVEKPSFSPRESAFSLNPPSESLIGRVLSVEEKVEKEPRDSEDLRVVEVGEKILQGEKLATKGGSSATVEFENFAQVTLGPNSEISFVSLIPQGFLVGQASGSVDYELIQREDSLSVRVLHSLIEFSEEGRVEIDGDEVSVKAVSGTVKLAMVDLDNKTQVVELAEGQTALIIDSQRRIEIE